MLSLLNKLLKRELLEAVNPPKTKKTSDMRTFYVNAFNCKKSDNQAAVLIGLFDSNEWSGMAGFGVRVGNEYYLGAKLLAYYKIKPHPFIVNFHNRCGDVKICGKQYPKIPIISRNKEKRLEADSVESAIEKFAGFEFV
jgi:hypothetical protein